MLRGLRPGSRDGPVAVLSRADGKEVEFSTAGPVILATGGAGSLYRQSSNPSIATGEGVAIAFRAGALLTDMEFIQFHPTAFCREGAPRFLITEALRGEGAVLRNEAGDRFLVAVHPDAELAPRDIVARAIEREIVNSGHPCVYLDATALPRDLLYARFPSVCHFLASYGLDPSRDQIPVAPAAHYMIGGVTTDLEGRSSLPGFTPQGRSLQRESTARTGSPGNSLLEGLVFGERVARQLIHPAAGGPKAPSRIVELSAPPPGTQPEEPEEFEQVRTALWDEVGIVRSADGLRSAVEQFERLAKAVQPTRADTMPGPVANAALTALLIARAAMIRTESRGAHFRADWPKRRPQWRIHVGLRLRAPSGRPK